MFQIARGCGHIPGGVSQSRRTIAKIVEGQARRQKYTMKKERTGDKKERL